MVSVNIQLEEKVDSQLNLLCDRKGYSKDTLIRNLILHYLDRDDAVLSKKLGKTNFSALLSIMHSDDDYELEDTH